MGEDGQRGAGGPGADDGGEDPRDGTVAGGARADDGGGDPVCWLERVCDRCGGLSDGPPGPRCDRCGAALR